MRRLTEDQIKQWLEPVQDPELLLSLVGLGLIYHCEHAEDQVATIHMTMTSPSCPFSDQLMSNVKNRMLEHEDVKDVILELVWEPKWDPKIMANEETKDVLGLW